MCAIKICLLFCIISASCAADNSSVDCSNEDIVTSIFNTPIALTLSDIILVYEHVAIERLISTANNEFDKNYIDARLEQDAQSGHTNLLIYATEHFARYAQEQTAMRITLKIVLDCGMGRERTLIFFQPIREDNYFRPTFAQAVYEVIMPTPIFAGFDLTVFTAITARDDDLTNNQIEFSSAEAAQKYHITVGTRNDSTSADGKTYSASLTLERIYLALHEELKFEIMAKDHGSPPLNSTATVVVRADAANSLPPTPQFQHSLYNATLNNDLTLEALRIRLTSATVDLNEFNFSKSAADSELFDVAATGDGVEVRLAHTLTLADIKSKPYLRLIIGVEHSRLAERRETAVLVLVPHVEDFFQFAKPLYKGFIDSSGHLQLIDIIFGPFAYSNDMVFRLDEATQSYFNLQRDNNKLQLNLTADFDMEIWQHLAFISMEIEATLEDLRAVTAVILALPRRQIEGGKPMEFQKPLYIGYINDKLELLMETILLNMDALLMQQVVFNLSGNGSEHFDIVVKHNNNNNNIELLLQPTHVNAIKANIILLLTAELTNSKAYATIAVEVADSAAAASSLLFQSTWYTGRIELIAAKTQALHLAAITLKSAYNVSYFAFSLSGAEAAYFEVILVANHIQLHMLQPLPAQLFAEKSQINLALTALQTANNSIYQTVPIFIELPRKDCAEAVSNISLPVFDSSAYIFAAKPNQIGSLGQVGATVSGSNATLHYSLNVNNEHLQKRLSINPTNGELLLLSYVSSGVYHFRINAENVVTSARTSVDARLDVDSLLQCAEQQMSVAYSLIVKYIEEEREHLDILNTSMAHCQLDVTHMYPNDKAYVYINESTKMLCTIAIDREDVAFARMSVPQLQVRLKLHCDNETHNITGRSARDVSDESGDNANILAADMPYAQDLTVLNLILLDVNDNAPQFVQPEQSTQLAYPASQISFELFPAYLTRVRAVDRDTNLNAHIRYGMRANQHFGIDAASGVIYPKAHALAAAASTELLVSATDRNGAADGLRTELALSVRRLSADYFSLLTLSGGDRASLNSVLAELSARTSYSIMVVKQATLTHNEPQRRRRSVNYSKSHTRATDNEVVQQAWIYAFAGKEPVRSAELQSKLLALTNISQHLEAESFAATGLTSNRFHAENSAAEATQEHVAYIVAVTILSLISSACICFLLWRFYKHNYVQNATSKPASNGGSNSQQSMIPIKDAYTPHINEDDSCAANIKDEVTLKKSPERRRSQVTFNELVNRIHIDVDEATKCD